MALDLRGCLTETCDGFNWTDTTGAYDATSNPGGYGIQNTITGPSDFETYTLRLWAPSANPATDDPTFSYDLLADVPTPDSDDYYTWVEDPGLQTSGVWYVRVVATADGETYEVNQYVILTKDINDEVDAACDSFDLDCACKEGCEDPYALYTLLMSIKPKDGCGCNDVCSLDKVRTIIDYLYSKTPLCGC